MIKHSQKHDIKALDNNRIGGYLVRFTSEDDVDLHGEWFSKDTEFYIETGYPVKGDRTLFEHAFDNMVKVMPIGILDLANTDDIGIWVEAKLHDRAEYERMLRQLRDNGKNQLSDADIVQKATLAETAIKTVLSAGTTQWSSGALPQGVIVNEDNNHIDAWPIIEATVTFTPAEPDGTQTRTIKSAFEQLQELLQGQSPAPTFERTKDHEPVSDTSDGADIEISQDDIPTKDDNTMDEELIREIVRMVLEEYHAMQDEDELDEEEAVASVTAEMSKAEDDEELDEEELAKSVAEKAWGYVEAKRQKRDKALAAARQMSQTHIEALKREAGQRLVPAYTGNGNGVQSRTAAQIQVKSQYDHWQPEDFSFALAIADMTRGSNRPLRLSVDQRFYREFADKAEKAYSKGELRLNAAAVKGIHAIKADELDYSTQSGFGDEWVFTAWSNTVWDKPRLDNVVVPLFEPVEMPSNPYEYPVESTDPTVFAVSETADENQLGRNDTNAALPDSKIASAKVQISASKHALRVNISAELEEDGIARLMPKFREQAERTVMDAHDNVVLNGDTSTSGNINLDGGTPTTENYTSYDGLIHQPLVTATTNRVDASGAAPTLGHIRKIRGLLGNAQGFNPRNLAIITDFQTYMKLLDIDAVLTMDKYGSNATVMTGELGRIDGIPVFVSGQMALADTDGKITDGGNVTDTGRLLIVYRPDWFVGFRRRITQYVTFLPYADAWELVMTVRHGLAARSYSAAGAQQSTDDSVSLLYNIGV